MKTRGYLTGYLVRRLGLLLPLLIGMTLVTFMLIRIGGTDPAAMLAGPTASQEQLDSIDHELGLDKPLVEQYGIYLANLARGNLGDSYISGRPVLQELAARFPVTLELVSLGMALAILYGVTTGFVAALWRGRTLDHVLRIVTLLGLSMPVFWVDILFIYVFFFQLEWAPAPLGRLDAGLAPPPRITGAYILDSVLAAAPADLLSAVGHIVLPVLTLGLIEGSGIAKQTRAQVLEVLDSDIVRSARACGLPRRQVWWIMLHNALPNLITFMAIVFVLMLGGSALIELVFAWGGIGQFGLNAITRADFAVVQGYVLALGIASALIYLVADLVVMAIDPRARRG